MARSPESLVRQFGTRNPFDIATGLEIQHHFVYHPESGRPGLTCFACNHPSIFINVSYFDLLQKKDPTYTDEMVEYDVLQVGAHELGHAICHRKELKKAPIMEYEIFDVRTTMEVEANTFAAGIRIDTREMLEYFNSELDFFQVARTMNVNINLLIYKVDQLRRAGYKLNNVPFNPRNSFMGDIHGLGK